MKFSKIPAVASMVLVMLSFSVHAQCTGAPLTPAQIRTLLTGNLLCGSPGSGYTGNIADRWQEEHLANGDLFDYKRGPGHPVDPREKVGTWLIGGSRAVPTVTHTYGPTTSYAWRIFGPTVNNPGVSVYSFCTPTGTVQQVRAFVITSTTGCNNAFP